MGFRRRAFGSGGFSTDNRTTFGRVRKRRVVPQRSQRSRVVQSLEPPVGPRERAVSRAGITHRHGYHKLDCVFLAFIHLALISDHLQLA